MNETKSIAALTIFFDRKCPLCVMEMQHLKRRDIENKIALEDIFATNFEERFPEINIESASKVLHGKTSTGEIILGLDVTHYAWSLVGKGAFTSILRWRPVKPFADFSYRLFARNRYTFSKLLTGKSRLENCESCEKLQR